MSTAPVLINRQMRFAVVMYGGGSLAIYINGVAQELLRMSQATDGNKRLYPGMTAVYRKIALLLSGHNAVYEKVTRAEGELSELQKSPKSEKRDAQIAAKEAEIAALLATDVTVEFIIDVLSGSSAGGINSVFLSKALIGGTPDMSDLQKLWLEEGDFAKLLNDRDSVRDNDLEAPLAPTSLLNSQRMYLQLLKALDGMSARFSKDAGRRQPLDLFVTYTDFDGLPTKLILSDKTVLERVHKRVFNFRYDADRNDFKAENNPFLAFAARCTSSFPVAFDAMKLSQIDDIIRLAVPNHPADSSLNKDWDRFFEQISDQHGELVNWRERWFVDGGCLDNKPFSYAISKLTERAGEGIVERKLLYIEPSPEDFNRRGRRRGEAPNAVENVFAQAAGLPSYETIREDLQRVLDHNRLIERVNRLTEEVEQDFAQNGNWLTGFVRRNSAGINWKNADFRNVILEKGAAFIPYYRLRIGSATEQLAQFANHVIRTEPQSVDFGFLRTILRLWRATRYTEYRSENFKTYNRFLHDFDLEYRHRRLRFVLQKAESMLTELDGFRSRLKSIATDRQVPTKQTVESTPSDIEATSETVVQNKFGTLSFDGAVWTALPGKTDEERRAAAATLSGLDDADYAASIIAVQSELRNAYDELRRNSERLRTAISSDPDESDKSTFSRQTALIREALAQVKSAVGGIWRENEAELGRIVKASGRNARPSETDRLLLALFHENKLPTALTSPLTKFTAILLETLHGEDGVLTRTSAIVKKALAIGDDARRKIS